MKFTNISTFSGLGAERHIPLTGRSESSFACEKRLPANISRIKKHVKNLFIEILFLLKKFIGKR
jgi:hypothetical protein